MCKVNLHTFQNKPETIPTARIDELSDAERADQNKTMVTYSWNLPDV